ncbi:MAG: hydantoinase/oxoprolinase family protein [Proteobacteria bacterium]|nr:hydantoinase/oxoprolinase family protein [Pseudomonadota bacterium]
MSFKVGIDVGGTFTDLFLWSEESGAETFKVLSTPSDPSIGVFNGLETMAESKGLTTEEFAQQTSLIVHGTTVTTNAVLTRTGAVTGLVTTEGVRDALEMRRGIREKQYDNRYCNVVPLVPRHRRLPIRERLDFSGQELTALRGDDVSKAANTLQSLGVESIAICFMHSYVNDSHEQQAAELIRTALPDTFLSVSSEVLPTIRFYDRVSTTVLNAYVGPVLRRYLNQLTARLANAGFGGVLLIMQSNGGVATPEVTLATPATTLLSGPAAGPRAAAAFANELGHDACLLMDMGGTSFDASLVRGQRAALSAEGEIDRLRIALPMLDIVTVGAGGGSIGWMDEGGLLRMGPQSAGAAPGPACYGRGGTLPACTDADLVLGYLDPTFFAGGRLHLDVELAKQAIDEHVAKPLGIETELAAAGMYRVINTNMAHGLREITIKRGLDPREFPLVVAGGAGGLHACMIAAELEIPSLIVPAPASILCAIGMLLCDLQNDFVRSCIGPLDAMDLSQIQQLVDEMQKQGESAITGTSWVEHQLALDLRYLKQYHEVTVPIPTETLASGQMDLIAQTFHETHNRLYGYDLATEGTGLELINVRVRSIGHTNKPSLPRIEPGGPDPSRALKGQRRVFVPELESFESIPVYDGHALRAQNIISGPALVERVDTTLFISNNFTGRVDELGSIALQTKEVAHG